MPALQKRPCRHLAGSGDHVPGISLEAEAQEPSSGSDPSSLRFPGSGVGAATAGRGLPGEEEEEDAPAGMQLGSRLAWEGVGSQ